jgi:hypothetical protein
MNYESKLERWLDAGMDRADAALANDWYRTARRDCRALAREAGVTLAVAAGVVAAYSPNMLWSANLTVARRALGGNARGMRHNVAKVLRIIAGERPLDVLRGPKVTRFYRALMGDKNAVVLDRWMARAMDVDPSKVGTLYDVLEAACLAVAARRNIAPASLQAIVWTAVRGDVA